MLDRCSPVARSKSRLAAVARDTLTGFFLTARHTLMITGVIALCGTALLFVKPEVANLILASVSHPEPVNEGANRLEPLLLPQPVVSPSMKTVSVDSANAEIQHQQERLTRWISRRYRVATDATQAVVATTYQTAMELKLDPLLILSVMAIESRFNPFAESPVGAQGLMQVMTRVHTEKFEGLGGVEAALNPIANIKVGSRILKEYVRRGGSIEAGLKMYVGAAAMETDLGYGAKVLAEYARMKDVAMGKKVSIHSPTVAVRKPVSVEPIPILQEANADEADSPTPLASAEQSGSAL
jgi:hypothetical protein